MMYLFRSTSLSIVFSVILLAFSLSTRCPAQSTIADSSNASTEINDGPTALDRYVAAPDDTFAWQIVHQTKADNVTVYVIDLKSQTWLTPAEVDRTVWQHWLTVVKPDRASVNTAMMFVTGGSNGKDPPRQPDPRLVQLAMTTNSVVASIAMVPNQPLVFHQDGKPRYEDDLIGYTWDQFLKTGDTRWPARLPMVKAVVRGMDAVQSLFEREEIGGPKIDRFVVAGASKRGWTTWMTAAVDPRVCAIVPIVIDVLNANASMSHHFAAYGFWAPAIQDYVDHKIIDRQQTPRYQQLMQLVDPFAYRDRLTMPKCIINAAGDEFFLPDSSRFYFDKLPEPKMLCYVPNGDHSLDNTSALDTLIAFYFAILYDKPLPKVSWVYPDAKTIVARASVKPDQATLWTATNPQARDFRVESIGRAYQATSLTPQDDGSYAATVDVPKTGWSAFFIQFQFDIGAPTPLRLTTPVRVVPDTLPFAKPDPSRAQNE